MDSKPDDRMVIWDINSRKQWASPPKVLTAAVLDDNSNPVKSANLLSRAGFLTLIATVLGTIGLNGCAVFIRDRSNRVRRNRYQYCSCVPVCVCDLVCTCNLVSGLAQNDRQAEDKFTNEAQPGYVCKCVPVCTCDLVCTCDTQCTCQSQGRGGRTICTCNPYWYPN